MIMVQDSKGQLRPISRSGLITLLFIGSFFLALAAISFGFLLQLGAALSPYLLTFGQDLFKGAGIVFLAYRLLLLIVRLVRFIARRNQSQILWVQRWILCQMQALVKWLFFFLLR